MDVGEDEVAQRRILLRVQPVDELFDERVDDGAAGVDAPVRLFVRRAPGGVQPLELGAIGGQRPPAVGRHPRISCGSGTSSQTDSPSLLMTARFCGSTNVPPPVATTQ